MAPTVNSKILFGAIPDGYPELGKTLIYDESETIDLNTVPLDGGVLLKTLFLSLDPYMRGRMCDPDVSSYIPPFIVGETIVSTGVSVVIRSDNPNVQPGDHYLGFPKHQRYNVVKDLAAVRWMYLPNPHKFPWSWYLGILGVTGRTAFMAWKEFAQARSGDTVYVTTGAGAVGSVVIQLAKQDGMKVIASAGSQSKVDFMKECGADVAFNYKEQNTQEVLKKEGPIQVYWDNVGGTQLEAALEAAADGARFIECGMIESYNSPPHHIKNLQLIIGKGLHLHGFIVPRDLAPKREDEFQKVMPEKVAKGEFKIKEDITKGLDQAEHAFLAMLQGKNIGKVIVQVADD